MGTGEGEFDFEYAQSIAVTSVHHILNFSIGWVAANEQNVAASSKSIAISIPKIFQTRIKQILVIDSPSSGCRSKFSLHI